MRNLLNDTRALTFKLQATICREVDFQILSPQPISLGRFPLSTAGQGFLKLLNPTARDLSYTISAQNVELLLGDSCSQERKGDVDGGGTQSSRGGTQSSRDGTQLDGAQLSSDLNGSGTQLDGTQSSQNGTQSNGTQSLINETPSSFHPSEAHSPHETQIETQTTPVKHPSELPAIPARGYEACVEVRRARVTSSALRPDEREHLESSVGPISGIPEIEGKTAARYPRLQAERPPSCAGSPRKATGERIPHQFDSN